MAEDALLACFLFGCLIDHGYAGLLKIWNGLETPEMIFEVSDRQLSALLPAAKNKNLLQALLAQRDRQRLMENYQRFLENGIRFIGCMQPGFPQRLRQLSDCPFGLFYLGILPPEDAPALAVVGARDATARGEEIARSFSRELGRHGITVISGLAAGIDGWAHRGALEGCGRTWGVLGSGPNICYPQEHIRLFETMKTHGGLTTEFPPGSRPLPWHFPVRNRIISGLCDAILVVEARKKSGSLITAEAGLDQGKSVYAVPGRPDDPLSIGCNSLIFDGARPVNSYQDILEDFHIPVKVFSHKDMVLDNLENLVYSSLCLDLKSVEIIACEVQLDYAKTAKILYSLDAKGLVRRVGREYYIRRL